ncbi:hypothetical protein ACFL5Q_04535 [Planctomycetota bacterium]
MSASAECTVFTMACRNAASAFSWSISWLNASTSITLSTSSFKNTCNSSGSITSNSDTSSPYLSVDFS